MTRLLITGHNGFTGKYIVREAKRVGMECYCLTTDGSFNSCSVNLLDFDAVKRTVRQCAPTSVIHLAAVSSVDHADVNEIYKVNVCGTRNVLQALKEVNLKLNNVIVASSGNVYGQKNKSRISEDDSLNPVNDYAISKMAMEFASRLYSPFLPITITRPFNYTGAGQSTRFLIPKIVEAFKNKNEFLELGNLEVKRDFSDVRDVARFYIQLAKKRGLFDVVNICSGNLISLQDLLNICEFLTGHSLRVKSTEAMKRKNEINVLGGDPSRLDSLLGSPMRHSIRDTLEWMLRQNNNFPTYHL